MRKMHSVDRLVFEPGSIGATADPELIREGAREADEDLQAAEKAFFRLTHVNDNSSSDTATKNRHSRRALYGGRLA